MKRRYLCVGVSIFAFGILLFSAPYKIFWILFSALLLFGTALLFKRKIGAFIFALLFLTGGLYGNYANNISSPLAEYTKNPCSGKMFVTGISSITDDYITVEAKVTEVNDEKINEPILFTIYGINKIEVNTVIHFDELKFKIPDSARNDGSFDYNRYLKSKGIYYTASAGVDKLRAFGRDGFVVFRFFRTLKQKLTERCANVFGESYASQIMPAILVGDDTMVSGEVDGLFKKAGITHILVASGMHVGVVIVICTIILYPLKNRRRFYDMFMCLAVICFGIVVGMHPSMIRAVASFLIYFIARKTFQSADPVTVLFEAMAIILAINPLSIYNMSFLLSFSAVFGIIMFTPHLTMMFGWFVCPPKFVYRLKYKYQRKVRHIYSGIVSAAAVSVSAQLGVFPVMIWAFNGAAVFTLFVNIALSFLVPFVYGVGIVALIVNIEPFVALTKVMCYIFVLGARITSEIPGNYMSLSASKIITAASIIFILTCVLRCKFEKFTPFFESIVALCFSTVLAANVLATYVPENKAEVTFLNVEQGDCAIIRLANNKTVVIDTGTEAMCASEVISYLERKNTRKIDALIISHSDKDHAGGINLLTQYFETEKVVTSEFYIPDLNNIECVTVKKDDKFSVGNAEFKVLSPEKEYKNDNDKSLVVRMDFGKSSFLFTGDASENVEKELEGVFADVLKVSHHGAKGASSEEFLKKVSPEYSVISVDKDNSYGHPDKDTLKRIETASDVVFRTDRDKTITITADLDGTLKLTNRLERTIIDLRK